MEKQTSSTSNQSSRREFLQSGAALSFVGLAGISTLTDTAPKLCSAADALPEAFSALKPLGSRVHPITAHEYRARSQHAQKLMTEMEPKCDALSAPHGTSLYS